MKRVSVIIPCFNDGQYINEAIQSVKLQTYKNIEIIICDDGSTEDNTLLILEKYKQEGIQVLHLKNNGPASARNKGIEIASGEYILPLDADDKIEETYIEKAVKIIESDMNIGVVYCYADLFGAKTGRWVLPSYSFEEMLVDNIVFVTALFRKQDWKTVGGFCEDFTHGIEDYDFWLSILELGRRIYQIPEVLFYYRIKSISRTTKFSNDIMALKDMYNLIYDRHKLLYKNNMDIYCKSLRQSLIKQTVYIRKLEEMFSLKNKFKNKIDKFPKIKRMLKFIYKKIF